MKINIELQSCRRLHKQGCLQYRQLCYVIPGCAKAWLSADPAVISEKVSAQPAAELSADN